MYDVIKRYCESENENGLLLMDMPTGWGKTYQVLKYIHDATQDQVLKYIHDATQDPEMQGKKFFFLTTQTKNLPENDLQKMFQASGREEEFDKIFLRAESGLDCVVHNLSKARDVGIPDNIVRTGEYKNLETFADLYKENQVSPSSHSSEFQEYLKIKLMAAEEMFRKMISRCLRNEKKAEEERIQTLKSDRKWKWVSTLYPQVNIDNYRIIFMSVKKFLLPFFTIARAPFFLCDSDFINGAVIFIDEFDATKKTVLDDIIDTFLKNQVDEIDLFRRIYANLQTKKLKTDMTTDSSKQRGKSTLTLIQESRERAKEIYKR